MELRDVLRLLLTVTTKKNVMGGPVLIPGNYPRLSAKINVIRG